jgi:hypothetical protein
MNGVFYTCHQRWQYGQWRFAGDIPVNRYKTLRGTEAFKLPLRPPLVILRVGVSLVFISRYSLILFLQTLACHILIILSKYEYSQ